jgi:cytochrome c-type biogenesis protein CcmH/NrfG
MRYSILTAVIALFSLIPASAQPAKSHFQNGERLMSDGYWVFAAREFEQAVHLDPTNPRYQSRFAEVRIEASQWAESAANVLISADRNREAQSFIDDALRFDPTNARAARLLEQVNPAAPSSTPFKRFTLMN